MCSSGGFDRVGKVEFCRVIWESLGDSEVGLSGGRGEANPSKRRRVFGEVLSTGDGLYSRLGTSLRLFLGRRAMARRDPSGGRKVLDTRGRISRNKLEVPLSQVQSNTRKQRQARNDKIRSGKEGSTYPVSPVARVVTIRVAVEVVHHDCNGHL